MPQVKANGLTFEYDIHGKDSDPAVILIMGFSGPMIMWPMSFVNGLVQKGLKVIRFDNRDVGLSTHLKDKGAPDIAGVMTARAEGKPYDKAPYLLDDMAKDVVGILDALKIDKAHIVGASMGGMIAQIVAAKHGEKCISMTSIMSTTAKAGLTQAKPEVMAVLITPPASTALEDRVAAFVKTFRTIGSPGFPATDDELRRLATAAATRSEYDPEGVGRQMVAIMASEPRNDMLKNVACPVLVLHGKDDPLVPVDGGEDTAASIKGSKLVIVPGMAHDFTEALMPVFIKEVGGFIEGVEAGQKKAA